MLGLEFASGTVRIDQVDAILFEVVIESVTLVRPTESPPPLTTANVESMKLSPMSMVPSSRSVLANWARTSRKTSH